MTILNHNVKDNKNSKINNKIKNQKYKNNLIYLFVTGLASKKFLESNSCNVLWFSLIKILDTSEIIFTPEQYENIKTSSEDDMALISSNLTLFQQHLLGENSCNFLISLQFVPLLFIFLHFFFSLFYRNLLSYQKNNNFRIQFIIVSLCLIFIVLLWLFILFYFIL